MTASHPPARAGDGSGTRHSVSFERTFDGVTSGRGRKNVEMADGVAIGPHAPSGARMHVAAAPRSTGRDHRPRLGRRRRLRASSGVHIYDGVTIGSRGSFTFTPSSAPTVLATSENMSASGRRPTSRSGPEGASDWPRSSKRRRGKATQRLIGPRLTSPGLTRQQDRQPGQVAHNCLIGRHCGSSVRRACRSVFSATT